MKLSRSLQVASLIALACMPSQAQQTARASVATSGAQANSYAVESSLSGDGTLVVFFSPASNLVPGDTNAKNDVFVRDLATSTTTRVSLDSAGAQTGGAYNAVISADGRYVAFMSDASDLVPGDTGDWFDVFVHDRVSGTTERVSVSSSGVQGNFNSAYGGIAISADGRYVAFPSYASNLVAGDTNDRSDIFLRDRQSATTERVSVDSSGAEGDDDSGEFEPTSISADGRYVAFISLATNLVAGDTNGRQDVFVRDRTSGTTERASVDSSGNEAALQSSSPSISADGRYVAYSSLAANLVVGDTNGTDDIFVRDLQSATTERVSVNSSGVQGFQQSTSPAISGDGRFVAFVTSSHLVTPDTNGASDVFVRDLQLGTTERVSVDSFGGQANSYSRLPSISSDGRFVSFASYAYNLAPSDTNGLDDVFVHDTEPCSTNVASYCTAKVNSMGCTPAMTSTGTPSASVGSGFLIDAQQVLALRAGLLFYSVHGAGGAAFQGGILCATPPTRRTPLQTSSAAGSPPCIGLYSLDFNARIASGVDTSLVAGQQVWSQYWTRDGGVPSGTGLTNGLTFVICQ